MVREIHGKDNAYMRGAKIFPHLYRKKTRMSLMQGMTHGGGLRLQFKELQAANLLSMADFFSSAAFWQYSRSFPLTCLFLSHG
jgi:hypothetical protein